MLEAPGTTLHRDGVRIDELELADGVLELLVGMIRHPRYRVGLYGRPGMGRRTLLLGMATEVAVSAALMCDGMSSAPSSVWV